MTNTSTTTQPVERSAPLPDSIPVALADVALVTGPTCAAAASISISQWHELVRRGEAPQPAIRSHRCTRWRLADVRAWLTAFAERGRTSGASTIETTRRASDRAMTARHLATRSA